MDGYTLSISRCSGGDGVEESFKAKIKRREAALDAFAVAEAYCKESWMVSRCEREGFDGFIIELCSDAEDETIRLVRLVPDSEEGIMDGYRFRVHYPEEWEFGLITGATFFGKRGLVLQHGEDDVSSFTLNPSWLSCEDETQRCIMVEIYLEP